MTGQNPVFIPGPTNIPDRLRHAMGIETKDHRSPDFGELLAPLLSDLKKIFKTAAGQVFTFTGSGIPSSAARARGQPRNTTVGQRGPRCAAPPRAVTVRDAEVMRVAAYGDVMSPRPKSRVSVPAAVSLHVCRMREEWRGRRTPRSVRRGASLTIHHHLPRPET